MNNVMKCFLTVNIFFFSANLYAQECIKLNKIILDENKILNLKTQEKLFENYTNKCLETPTIKKLLNIVSKYYIDNGYITTKPYLKEQNILDGEIDISILQGKIEDIVDDETNSSNLSIKTAFIFQKGKVLNLRDLETSLEMINRVPSVDATLKVEPGSKEGFSIVKIHTKKEFPLHLQLGVTGKRNIDDKDPYLTADISIDNPFSLNDILTFRKNGSRLQKDYQSTLGKEMNYSFALGSYVVEFIWFDFLYDQKVVGLNDIYLSEGKTEGLNLRVNKILHRNQHNIVKLAFSVSHKDTKNYFSQELIDVSSYKTTVARIDLTHTYIQNWGQLISGYSFYKGTNWFGAKDDYGFNDVDDEKLQFLKHTLSENIYYYLFDGSYQLNTNFHWQFTNDVLYDNNKLGVGSFYTVRGYESSYYGDNGWYVKNDFIKTFRPDINSVLINTISTFIGLDYGYVKCQSANELACGKLAGTAIGFKTNSSIITTDFTWSRALQDVSYLNARTLFRYNVTMRF